MLMNVLKTLTRAITQLGNVARTPYSPTPAPVRTVSEGMEQFAKVSSAFRAGLQALHSDCAVCLRENDEI